MKASTGQPEQSLNRVLRELQRENIQPDLQQVKAQCLPLALADALVAKGLLTEEDINVELRPKVAAGLEDLIRRVREAKRPKVITSAPITGITSDLRA